MYSLSLLNVCAYVSVGGWGKGSCLYLTSNFSMLFKVLIILRKRRRVQQRRDTTNSVSPTE